MSSEYYDLKLEERRKKQLEKELRKAMLAEMKKQKMEEEQRKFHLQVESEAARKSLKKQIQKSNSINEQTYVIAGRDTNPESISEHEYDNSLTETSKLVLQKNTTENTHVAYDFSELLDYVINAPIKLQTELTCLLNMVSKRLILSEKDETDHIELHALLSRIVNNDAMDIEDKVIQVRKRVNAYINSGTVITPKMEIEIKERYDEYRALCSMTGRTPIERTPYRVGVATEQMLLQLNKESQDNFVMDVIESIMTELGGKIKDEAILSKVSGKLFAIDGHPHCDVFIGNDGNGLMFEPVGDSQNKSLEINRQIEVSSEKMCGMYTELKKRAAEHGIILRQIYAEKTDIDRIYKNTDVKRKKKIKEQKERELRNGE